MFNTTPNGLRAAGMAIAIALVMGESTTMIAQGVTIMACAKNENGQLRLAGDRGCNPSETPVSWTLETALNPREATRTLSIGPGDGGRFNGIFGGLLCGTGTLVSGGFRILRPDVEIRESFVGEAFSVPRVYVVFVLTKTGAALPPGDVVQMFATCI